MKKESIDIKYIEIKKLVVELNFGLSNGSKSLTDVINLIKDVSKFSLSLAMSVAQHYQVFLSILEHDQAKEVFINSLDRTVLSNSATTSINGASISSFPNLIERNDYIKRECPIISFISQCSHLLITGKINGEPRIWYIDLKMASIENSVNISCFGMKNNLIQSSDVIFNKSQPYINKNLTSFISSMTKYASLLWSASWISSAKALYEETIIIQIDKLTEKSVGNSKLNELLSIELELRRLEAFFNATLKDSDNKLDLNLLKLTSSEVCNNIAEKCMLLRGFKNGYVNNSKNESFFELYRDLKSSRLQLNNLDLKDILFEQFKIKLLGIKNEKEFIY